MSTTTQAAVPSREPSLAYGWYVVGLLSCTYAVSFIDRMILSLLIEPIQADLQITDTQISLLVGFSFAVCFAALGLPIGRLADYANRRNIIVIGVALWSLATALCGLARNFWQLFFARMLVGVGEASLSPSATSMIADYFPPHKLAKATSVFCMGVFVGSGLALVIGGAVIDMVSEAGRVTLPLLGTMSAWQLAMLTVGLPGLPLALLLFLTVREPARLGLSRLDGTQQEKSLRNVLRFAREHRRTLLAHTLGFSVTALSSYGTGIWLPTFYVREYGWTPGETGINYGMMVLVFATAGVFIGGWLSDWLEARGYRDAKFRTVAYGFLAMTPFGIAGPLVDDPMLSLALLAPAHLFTGFPLGLASSALTTIAPNRMRGLLMAFNILVVNLIGLGLGPTLVALTTDYVFGDPQALGYSIALMFGITGPLAALILGLGMKPLRNSVEAARRAVATASI